MTVTEQEQCFRQWLAAHQGLLWRVARSFASTMQDQEDLIQDMMLQL